MSKPQPPDQANQWATTNQDISGTVDSVLQVLACRRKSRSMRLIFKSEQTRATKCTKAQQDMEDHTPTTQNSPSLTASQLQGCPSRNHGPVLQECLITLWQANQYTTLSGVARSEGQQNRSGNKSHRKQPLLRREGVAGPGQLLVSLPTC